MNNKIFCVILVVLVVLFFSGCGNNPVAPIITSTSELITYEVEVQGTKPGAVFFSESIRNIDTGSNVVYHNNDVMTLSSTYAWKSVSAGQPRPATANILVYWCKVIAPVDQSIIVKVIEREKSVALYSTTFTINKNSFLEYIGHYN